MHTSSGCLLLKFSSAVLQPLSPKPMQTCTAKGLQWSLANFIFIACGVIAVEAVRKQNEMCNNPGCIPRVLLCIARWSSQLLTLKKSSLQQMPWHPAYDSQLIISVCSTRAICYNWTAKQIHPQEWHMVCQRKAAQQACLSAVSLDALNPQARGQIRILDWRCRKARMTRRLHWHCQCAELHRPPGC